MKITTRALLTAFTFMLFCFINSSLSSGINTRLTHKRLTEPTTIIPENQLPWVLQTRNSQGRWCNAFLITCRHAISAAHCFDIDDEIGNLAVQLIHYPDQPTIKVTRFITHPKSFDSSTGSDLLGVHDIMLMELEHPVVIDVPAILDFREYNCSARAKIIEHPLTVSFHAETVLKEANLTWINEQDCHLVKSYWLEYSGALVSGDSGAPLFYARGGKFYILGSSSAISSVGKPSTFFAPIAANSDFISSLVNLNYTNDYERFYRAVSLNISAWSIPPSTLSNEEFIAVGVSSAIVIIGIVITAAAAMAIIINKICPPT